MKNAYVDWFSLGGLQTNAIMWQNEAYECVVNI